MSVPDWQSHDPLWYDHTRKYLIKTFGLDRLEGNAEVRARHLLVALAYLNWPQVTDHGEGADVTWEDIEDFLALYGVPENRGNYGIRYSTTMHLVDKILDAHGVEAVFESGGELNHHSGDLVMEFVNTGDTYSATVVFDLETEEAQVTTWGDWVEEWEKGAWDADGIIERLHTIDVADHLVLADGSILVASHDDIAEADSDDPETQKAMQEAINDGDAWCIFHVNGRAQIMDDSPLCGMVGYGDAEAAMVNFAEQMGWARNAKGEFDPSGGKAAPPAPPAPKPPTPAPPPVQKTAHPTTAPLTPQEEGMVDWMLRMGWYTNREDAVGNIMRQRKARGYQEAHKRGLQGLKDYYTPLMTLPSWRRRG